MLQVEKQYLENGINSFHHENKKAYNKPSAKVTNEIEKEILDLRITKRFGWNQIRSRLKCLHKILLSTRIIYRILQKRSFEDEM